jgi:hypothetical protein
VSAQPISFSFEPRHEGGHVRVVVRCGPEGGRALCGELMMRTGEWSLLRWLLDTTPPLQTTEAYIPEFARGKTPVMCYTPISMEPIVVQPDRWPEVLGERIDALIAQAEEVADVGG